MRNRKKKAAEGDEGDKPKPKVVEQPRVTTKDEEKLKSSKSSCFRTCAKALLVIFIVVLVLTVFLPLFVLYGFPRIIREWEAVMGYDDAATFHIPPEAMDTFRLYDVDGNNMLDPYEFINLLQQFQNFSEAIHPMDNFKFTDPELAPDKEVLIVEALFDGIVKDSMTKFSKDQPFLGKEEQLLPGLMMWKQAVHPIHEYGVENFRHLMPSNMVVGQPYYIINPPLSTASLHSNRYRPTQPANPKEEFLYALISQLHANAFLHMRFAPQGIVGVVRAISDNYVDILIRAHIEFQLNQEPSLPFWFTPAQLAGRLVIRHDAKHIELMEFRLPTEKQLNIDMEWITAADGSSNEVDIGFVSLMELRSVGPSRVLGDRDVVSVFGTREYHLEPGMAEAEMEAELKALDEKETAATQKIMDQINQYRVEAPRVSPDSMQWNDEISIQSAKELLEVTLYPFKQVKYYDYLEAFGLAKVQNKLVHVIMLWGALDDQSC